MKFYRSGNEKPWGPELGRWCLNSFISGLLLGVVLVFGTSGLPVAAQVVTDGSLGNQTALSGPEYTILQSYGQVRGGNLFHSFSQFTVNTGERATFESGPAIENILARVTGGSESIIAGQLNATANLFLLNPAGILFTDGASLNVAGDVNISTADYIRFDDGSVFNVDPSSQSSLTVAAPSAFGFLGSSGVGIQLDNAELSFTESSDLTLIGNELNIQGSTIAVNGGELNLIAADSTGEISLARSSRPPDAPGNININQSTLEAGGLNSGIFIRGGRIVVESGSVIESIATESDDSGKVEVKSTSLRLTDGSLVRGELNVETEELDLSSNAKIISDGNVLINTGRLSIQDGGRISSDTVATSDQTQNAGDIAINAESIVIDSLGSNAVTGITSDTVASLPTDTAGGGGNINIVTGEMTLSGNSTISSNSLSEGDSGSIDIHAQALKVSGGATISSASLNNLPDAGSAGTITITAGEIDVSSLGRIRITTQGSGDGGSLVMRGDSISIRSGGSIQASSFGLGNDAGNVGSIALETDNLAVTSGGAIFANSEGGGDGSSINIDAGIFTIDRGILASQAKSSGGAGSINITGELITLDNNSQITSDTTGANLSVGSGGNAGNINIFVDALSLNQQSSISNSTASSGSAGQLSINASSIALDNNSTLSVSSTGQSGNVGNISIFSNRIDLTNGGSILARNAGSGNPGTIGIYTRELSLRDAGLITTFSTGSGAAGDISISAENNITLDNGASISSESISSGGGDIRLNATSYIRVDESGISTSVPAGVADGGNITIDPVFVILNNGSVTARAFGGNGGNITIATDFLFQSGFSVIDATSDLGLSGNLSVTSPNNEFDKELVPIAVEFLEAGSWLSQPCAQRTTGTVSSLVVSGRDGNIAGPADLRVSDLLFEVPLIGGRYSRDFDDTDLLPALAATDCIANFK